jgi:exosortase
MPPQRTIEKVQNKGGLSLLFSSKLFASIPMDLTAQKPVPSRGSSEPAAGIDGHLLTGRSVLQSVVLLAFLWFLYAHVVANLARQWFDDPNYSHGIFVPICSALLLWIHRKSWMATPLQPSAGGLLFVVAAMGLLLVGTLGAELFLPRFSLCILAGGLVVYFAGWRMLRAVLAPWLALFLMIPLPVIVFNEIAFPLQVLASRLACSFLELLQVPVLREGNIIVLSSMSLDIVEACSGLRSLMSLITVAVLYGLFFERKIWMRFLLVIVAIPVAVFANSLRIVSSALLAQYVSPHLAEGFFHAFSGFLLFLLCLGALAGFHTLGIRLSRRRAAV